MSFFEPIDAALFSLIISCDQLTLISGRTLKFTVKPPLWTRITIKITMMLGGKIIWVGPMKINNSSDNEFIQRSYRVKLMCRPEPGQGKINGTI
jgi:hypothetical protein